MLSCTQVPQKTNFVVAIEPLSPQIDTVTHIQEPSKESEQAITKIAQVSILPIKTPPNATKESLSVVVDMLWKNGLDFQSIHPDFRENLGLAKIALYSVLVHDPKKITEFLADLPESLQASLTLFREKAQAILAEKPKYTGWEYFIEQFSNDRDILTAALQIRGGLLCFASKEIQDTAELVKIAVQQNAIALCSASQRLLDNEEIIETAVKEHLFAFRIASSRLQNDPAFIKRLVTQNGMLLKELNKNMKDNEEIVSLAVQQNKEALKFASQRLQNDETFLKIESKSSKN